MSTSDRTEHHLPLPARVLLLAGLLAAVWVPVPDPFTILFFACHALIGFLLVVRRPRNAIGWLLIVVALGFLGTGNLTDIDLDALVAGSAPWPDFVRAWLSAWTGGATFLAYLTLAVLYPSGRFDDRRGRIGKLLVGLGSVSVAAAALAPSFTINPDGTSAFVVPNRLGIGPDLLAPFGVSNDSWIVVTIALLGAAVIDLVIRFRRASGLVRVQMRWLVASLCAIVASVVVGLLATVILGDAAADVAWLPVIVAYPTLPLAVYIAVTRYRLYEIDRIVSRTVGWAVVSGVLLTVFAAGVFLLQAILSGITQGQTVAVAGSTLLAFALFQPVRRRVQRLVDRRFDRARYDAERTTGHFAERMRGEVALDAVEDALVRTVAGALRPTGIGVWLRNEGGRG
jgi:hypothetical protein